MTSHTALDQQVLSRDLHRATDKLYVKFGTVITPADKPRIKEIIEENMPSWDLDDVEVTLDDETEFVTITVRYGRATASIDLQWMDANGRYYARVDVDNDGK